MYLKNNELNQLIKIYFKIIHFSSIFFLRFSMALKKIYREQHEYISFAQRHETVTQSMAFLNNLLQRMRVFEEIEFLGVCYNLQFHSQGE